MDSCKTTTCGSNIGNICEADTSDCAPIRTDTSHPTTQKVCTDFGWTCPEKLPCCKKTPWCTDASRDGAPICKGPSEVNDGEDRCPNAIEIGEFWPKNATQATKICKKKNS